MKVYLLPSAHPVIYCDFLVPGTHENDERVVLCLERARILLGKKEAKEKKRTKGLYVLTTRVGVRISQQRKGTLVNWS